MQRHVRLPAALRPVILLLTMRAFSDEQRVGTIELPHHDAGEPEVIRQHAAPPSHAGAAVLVFYRRCSAAALRRCSLTSAFWVGMFGLFWPLRDGRRGMAWMY